MRAGKIIKIFCSVALVAFLSLLAFVIIQNSAKPLKKTYITDSFKEAYSISDDVRTHAFNQEFSENGGIYAYSLTYIPDGGYLQFTVRYNKRHIEEIKDEYSDFREKDISYILVDSEGNEYEAHVIEEKDKFHYHYLKLEFTDVDFEASELKVVMVLDGLEFNGGELTVHTSDNTSIPYKLSSKEKKQLT